MRYLPTDAIGDPMTDDEILAMGYEPTKDGWLLFRRPKSVERNPLNEQPALDLRNPRDDRSSVSQNQEVARNPVRDRSSVPQTQARRSARSARPKRPGRTR